MIKNVIIGVLIGMAASVAHDIAFAGGDKVPVPKPKPTQEDRCD